MSDPRPQARIDDGVVTIEGVRCTSCGHPMVTPRPFCAACTGPVGPSRFGPEGAIWASTVVRIRVGDRVPPYVLAYVDLTDGPRVLAHVAGDQQKAPAVGSRVRLTNQVEGDVVVEVAQ